MKRPRREANFQEYLCTIKTMAPVYQENEKEATDRNRKIYSSLMLNIVQNELTWGGITALSLNWCTVIKLESVWERSQNNAAFHNSSFTRQSACPTAVGVAELSPGCRLLVEKPPNAGLILSVLYKEANYGLNRAEQSVLQNMLVTKGQAGIGLISKAAVATVVATMVVVWGEV